MRYPESLFQTAFTTNSVAKSLNERGYNYLHESDLYTAHSYFQRALDADATTASAYWGLLLVDFQRSSTMDMLKLGVDLVGNSNYQYACKYASGEQEQAYRYAATLAVYIHHNHVIACVQNKTPFSLKWRSESYAALRSADRELVDLHKDLQADTNALHKTIAYMKLLHKHNTDPWLLEAENVLPIRAGIQTSYQASLNNILQMLYHPSLHTPKALARAMTLWATHQYEGIDFRSMSSNTVSERYLWLIQTLTETSDQYFNAFGDTGLLLNLCHEAVEHGADKVQCDAWHQRIYNKALQHFETVTELVSLANVYPQDAKPYEVILSILHKSATPDLPRQNIQKFIHSKPDQIRIEDGERLIDSLLQHKRILEKFPTTQQEILSTYEAAYIERAPHQAEAIRQASTEYFQRMETTCRTDILQADNDIACIRACIQAHKQMLEEQREHEKRVFKARNIRALIVGSLLTIVAVALAVTAFVWFRHPEHLLPVSTLWFTAAASAAVLVFILLSLIISSAITNKPLNNSVQSIVSFESITTPILSAVAIALLIVGAIRFPTAYGPITISQADDLKLLRYHPASDFVLEQDVVTTEDTEFKPPLVFLGTLDGQGHAIQLHTLQEASFVTYQCGELTNTIWRMANAPEEAFSLVSTNRGIIKECTLEGAYPERHITQQEPSQFHGFCLINKGELIDSATSGIRGQYTQFAGLTPINDGMIDGCAVSALELDISERFAGIAVTNHGTLKNSRVLSVRLNTIADTQAETVAGLAEINTSPIEDCYVNDLRTYNSHIDTFAGLVIETNADITNCRVSNIDYNGIIGDHFGGLVCETNASLSHCEVQGNVNIVSDAIPSPNTLVPHFVFGGAAAKQTGGTIADTKAALNVNIRYDHIYHGGFVIGGIAGTTNSAVERSCFIGDIHMNLVESTVEDTTIWDKAYPIAKDVYVGGIYGTYTDDAQSVRIENCYSAGSQAFDIGAVDTHTNMTYYAGGFTASYADIVEVVNSFSNMTIRSNIPDNNSPIINGIHNSIGGFMPDSPVGGSTFSRAENSFYAGNLQAPRTGYHVICMWGSRDPSNCYYTDDCGFGDNGTSAYNLTEPDFVYNTLGWDANIWSASAGSFPVLLQVGVQESNEQSEVY